MNRAARASKRLRTGPSLALACICVMALSLSGCVTDAAIAKAQGDELANPPADVVATVARLQPGVAAWYRDAEVRGLAVGRPLDADETRLAREVGVAEPGRVRIVTAYTIPPPPEYSTSKQLTSTFGSRSAVDAATTFGHAIYISKNYVHKRWLIAHELTHVAQFETLGMDGFVHDYLLQLMLFGHSRAPMERAAEANEHLGT